MTPRETEPLREEQLTAESHEFARRLFTRFPALRAHAAMERRPGPDRWSLLVTVPAPSGDPKTQLVVWVEDDGEPSVAFGDWHTHESVWGTVASDGSPRDLLDLVDGILVERFVSCEDVGGIAPGSATILDLSVADAVLDEITSKYSPGSVRLRSWVGRFDGIVGLSDSGSADTPNPALLPPPQGRRG